VKYCPHGQTSQVQQAQDEDNIEWNDYKSKGGQSMTNQSTMSQVQSQLQAISMEEKGQLANEMGVSEDFTQA
jgi:hypothetical protein